MQYVEVSQHSIPMPLLLEADPSESNIHSYLAGSWCFVAKNNNEVIGVCVVKTIHTNQAELFNIAVLPQYQSKGIGTKLLTFVLTQLKTKEVRRVELGTGSFGYQLTFYQRHGFRVDSIIKDHFLAHYVKPIYENGVQHKDMLRLYINL
ncbi:MAG: GNAT family N-acetyltransferase [Aliivibrio sp.]|uniref:GNAT family N-acetyltransferase n=1 Tax=Aliivibrio sp. TaxID=1872443 RepID=UPI001A4BCBE8|nr:GNAT family N-acetyltransferase [Aliivibrio sp.]